MAVHAQVAALQARLSEAEQAVEELSGSAGELAEAQALLAAAEDHIHELQARLDAAEAAAAAAAAASAGPAEDQQSGAAEREAAAAAAAAVEQELRVEVEAARAAAVEMEQLRADLGDAQQQVSDAEQRATEAEVQLEALRRQLAEAHGSLAELRQQPHAAQSAPPVSSLRPKAVFGFVPAVADSSACAIVACAWLCSASDVAYPGLHPLAMRCQQCPCQRQMLISVFELSRRRTPAMGPTRWLTRRGRWRSCR